MDLLDRGSRGGLEFIFFYQISKFRGCLALLYELCSTNSTMEQLHKKLEFVEYLVRCSHNSTLFPRTECVELKPFG